MPTTPQHPYAKADYLSPELVIISISTDIIYTSGFDGDDYEIPMH